MSRSILELLGKRALIASGSYPTRGGVPVVMVVEEVRVREISPMAKLARSP